MDSNQKKILIVEDNKTLQDMYKMRFEIGGYVVKTANDGLEAITYAVDFKPDAILLDIMMPTMDGMETLRALRVNAPSVRTKIVVFSNLGDQKTIDKCMTEGANEYLLKVDYTPGQIYEHIEKLLQDDTRS